MYFKRKAYNQLLDWKNNYADKYAVLLEGARRVGKSTIAEQFAQNEYKSYVLIDFSKASSDVKSCFDDLSNLLIFCKHFFFFFRKFFLTKNFSITNLGATDLSLFKLYKLSCF